MADLIDPDDLITIEEAAKLAGIGAATLRGYTRRGLAPQLVVDGPKHSRRAILAWMDHGRVGQGKGGGPKPKK